jgi:HEPN domain-containing protein
VEVRRTKTGRLVAIVDRRDPEADRMVRDAVGEGVGVLDRGQVEALSAFGDESPLAGSEILLARGAGDGRAEELVRVARRRLLAARRLAEAGLGAEAMEKAFAAMQARLRALLPEGGDVPEGAALSRAVYERLLPEGRVTLEQASALGRVGDLARAYADRDVETPPPLVSQALDDAARFVQG